MPIPKPKTGESRQDYMSRCMGDSTMRGEYSDSNQRFAVCTNEYSKKSSEDSKEQVRRDVFTTRQEAQERAEVIGCEGVHSHTEDGQTVFMPCSTHDEYEELTGDEVNQDSSLEELKSFIEVHSEIKTVSKDQDMSDGEFEGYASVFNNTDLGNDVITDGAFAKSLRKRGAKGVKLLYQHKSDMPIGVFTSIKEDDHGLKVKGKLAMNVQAGKEAYELLKMGALDGLSIGFKVNPQKVSYDKRTKKRIIDELDLMEISLVTFPMNPAATVRSVKGTEISIREWENGLRDAFSLSRSESKQAARAVFDVFNQREVEENTELVDAIRELTKNFKTEAQ